ncbi:unnamed protein product [Spirodela intermedia]|uniref:Uncharacterized protein n=1 Tax=Spirodela intermedia TaxID=51605 RepID=A0A7I8LC61_SPIIN|nr:unnamed protein product [Spirodela intermedia]
MVFLQRVSASGTGRRRTGGPPTTAPPPPPPPPVALSAAEGSQPWPRPPSGGTTVGSQLRSEQADHGRRTHGATVGEEDLRVMFSVLADAGCTLCASGPPLLPTDTHKFRRRLECRFALLEGAPEQENPIIGQFLSGFSSYVSRSQNLHRILIPAAREGLCGTTGSLPKAESLARVLLLVAPLQPRLQHLLLEKLPEHFDTVTVDGQSSLSSSALEDDIARLIVNQFRWLDFVLDPEGLSEKLMEVLSISPSPLKREIIGSLPEIIGDCGNCGALVEALERMLQEDSELVVPVLDAFSNLNFACSQLDQVVTVALSCIRTVDAEHLPDLLRFLLISADKGNVGRIIFQIREQLRFFSVPEPFASRHKKLKGKSIADETEASILETLRSSLRFRNVLCDAIFKELKCLNQPQHYKAIDVWLLVLIHVNGGSFQKSVEKILKKKIVDGCIQESLFDQCIQGQKNLVKEYFPSFISLSDHLLTCKEEKARNFGIHLYTSLFEEFNDSYSRQEVLSSLVTHVGSGVNFEVGSALDAMGLLTSKYSLELIPISSHVNGILDYLEGFNDDNLRKVYEVFCQLSFSHHINADSPGASIQRELVILVRKQLGNPDIRYKKMGIIGTSKIVSILGAMSASVSFSSSWEANGGEALEFLRVSFDSCKLESSALILLYDELGALVQCAKLKPAIMEWMGIHLGDFESVFVTDLERGQLLSTGLYVGLEGEPWMNLDGGISVICLNILPMLSASPEQNSQSTIRTLPGQLLLLSTVESLTNHGSLEGIDALLGCPFHLPSKKYLDGSLWNSLTEKQKKILCFSLYYAINWIRELLNAFSSQVDVGSKSVTQGAREETTEKLLKRLRNIVFLESLLNRLLKLYPISLPKLHFDAEFSGSPPIDHVWLIEEKEGCATRLENASLNKKRKYKKKTISGKSDISGNLRQRTIVDAFGTGVLARDQVSSKASSTVSSSEQTSQTADEEPRPNHLGIIEMSAVPTVLYAQESKFRVLHVDCISILSLSKRIESSCCSDPTAELCLHLYLLRELHRKLDCLCPSSKPFKSSPSVEVSTILHMTATDFLGKVRQLFPSLRKHLDDAVSLLMNRPETCEQHWKDQHASAGNFDLPYLVLSNASVGSFVCQEVLYCYGKMMDIRDLFVYTSIPVLRDLLEALQPTQRSDDFIFGVHPSPAPGNIDYLYCGAYSFLEGVLNTACLNSLNLALEVLITLESLVKSIPRFLKLLEGNGKNISMMFNQEVFPLLQRRLGASAYKLLANNWTMEDHENPWKDKGDILPRIIHIYLRNAESTTTALVELACSILPQAPLCRSKSKEETAPGFPTICPATFVVWYRTLHEENIAVLENLTKGIIFPKNRKEIPPENAKDVFWKLQQSVDVVVSLVHMCKIHDKVSVHALAVKYGGKFVDIFLKSFDFLEAHFQLYKDIVIQMVKELQKATRTIQILCSEAKRGAKRTMVTCRVPAAKRSMERFLFRVKAMLHNTSNGCSFWMGNLKHKGLLGQVVSSQLCANEDEDGDEGGDGDGEAAPELLEADAGDSVAEGSEQGEETE